MPALVPRYTAAEIRTFPDHRVRYEVIRGELFVTTRLVERWLPGATTPYIATGILRWQPVATVRPLTINLPSLFRIVWAGLSAP